MLPYVTHRQDLKKARALFKRKKRLTFKNVKVSHHNYLEGSTTSRIKQRFQRGFVWRAFDCESLSPKRKVDAGKMPCSVTNLGSHKCFLAGGGILDRYQIHGCY